MRVRYGDIWDDWPNDIIVVPTNIGWKAGGAAVMGAGIAKQAADRYPEILPWWGLHCQRFRENTPVTLYPRLRMLFFPTKSLDMDRPWVSWKQDAESKLIWRSSAQLAAFTFDNQTVSIPLVGCGNGKLTPETVLPILKTFLNHQQYQLVAAPRERPLVEGIVKGAWDNWLLVDDPRSGNDGQPMGNHFLKDVT